MSGSHPSTCGLTAPCPQPWASLWTPGVFDAPSLRRMVAFSVSPVFTHPPLRLWAECVVHSWMWYLSSRPLFLSFIHPDMWQTQEVLIFAGDFEGKVLKNSCLHPCSADPTQSASITTSSIGTLFVVTCFSTLLGKCNYVQAGVTIRNGQRKLHSWPLRRRSIWIQEGFKVRGAS